MHKLLVIVGARQGAARVILRQVIVFDVSDKTPGRFLLQACDGITALVLLSRQIIRDFLVCQFVNAFHISPRLYTF